MKSGTKRFTRFEALLSRGNNFTTPKTSIIASSSQPVLSDATFVPPPTRPTSPVRLPAESEQGTNKSDKKFKSSD